MMNSTAEQAITVAEAAAVLRISPDLVRQWTRRGYLHPLPHRVNRAPAYLLADVLLLERERRRRPDTPIRQVACEVNQPVSR